MHLQSLNGEITRSLKLRKNHKILIYCKIKDGTVIANW